MSKIFVLDAKKRPLDPIHPAQARQLSREKKAAVFRRFPFTIILKELCPDATVSPLRLKIDPGAKLTGFALVNDSTGEVVFTAELKHRGLAILQTLTKRSQLRRSRRNRKTRYRQPRFLNRTRPKGWIAPSLPSRVDNIKIKKGTKDIKDFLKKDPSRLEKILKQAKVAKRLVFILDELLYVQPEVLTSQRIKD
jgi:hypothetical protein